jgi:hypothetical protein
VSGNWKMTESNGISKLTKLHFADGVVKDSVWKPHVRLQFSAGDQLSEILHVFLMVKLRVASVA